MINFDNELQKIFGDKYGGCTQAGDELVKYRLKPSSVATPEELAQVDALPKGVRRELDEIKAKIADYDNLKAKVGELEKKVA